jgi:hypothetical protein
MQHQANPSEKLEFATIVPLVTSTRHVAAAAFYHCLGTVFRRDPRNTNINPAMVVLATKNLVSLKQREPYRSISISIV